jgi:cob(I)alamin adenosyltransferase
MNPVQSGLVYIFTGDGKGKTSAALGTAVRAIASGKTAAMIQWYKSQAWGISEHQLNLPHFTIYPMGEGFYYKDKGDDPTPHQQAALAALSKATKLCPQVDVLILDEINNAVADGLLSLDQIKQFIQQRGTTHLILTGRNAHPDIIAMADLVTEMKKIKHPYDQGKLAIKGLDF